MTSIVCPPQVYVRVWTCDAVGALNVALAAVTSADLRFATAAPASARAVTVAKATQIPRLTVIRSPPVVRLSAETMMLLRVDLGRAP